MLFTPGRIGSLELPNRLVRSATAERMADEKGFPKPELEALYTELAQGGVGLIITGHMYVAPSGKCHEEMTGIYSDEHIPALVRLTKTVHKEGGKIAAQINHGGGSSNAETVAEPIAPSSAGEPYFMRSARSMAPGEIEETIQAYAQAARRAKESGFDAVQIHGAHGYLISQFTSPLTNKRNDQWGGNIENRTRFLRRVCQAIREQVGPDYPVFIKFGIIDGLEEGLLPEEGIQIISQFIEMGLDAVEISGGVGYQSTRKGIRKPAEEGYFMPIIEEARPQTDLPILAVGGFRSRHVMERALLSGVADFISLCRPLIREPGLPNLIQSGEREKSTCISANNCWPTKMNTGIACKCPALLEGD
ncbi:MAG: hypothetical protein B6243_08680 [Anaerolineaceae bacterium 4572_5.2]|nr:MAG: hypothetical protein B6243_08680 [Anaerolineaceae bacterium 4572_5.2]